jgi:hypothetical protein
MNVEQMELNKGQLKAIKHLERALKHCSRVHLAIFGKSSSLLAYNGTKYDKAREKGLVSFYRPDGAEDIPYESIDDSGAYRDSGADDMEYLLKEKNKNREE